MWKFLDFSFTYILGEINFEESRSCKTATFAILETLNFVNLVHLISFEKVQKSIKKSIFRALKCVKIADFAFLESQILISHKIWVMIKLWNFHTELWTHDWWLLMTMDGNKLGYFFEQINGDLSISCHSLLFSANFLFLKLSHWLSTVFNDIRRRSLSCFVFSDLFQGMILSQFGQVWEPHAWKKNKGRKWKSANFIGVTIWEREKLDENSNYLNISWNQVFLVISLVNKTKNTFLDPWSQING